MGAWREGCALKLGNVIRIARARRDGRTLSRIVRAFLLSMQACALAGAAASPANARPHFGAFERPWGCGRPKAFVAAARYNAAAESDLIASPFGRPERGWAIYEARIAETLKTRCPPASPGFAAAVARFQKTNGSAPHGAMTPETWAAMKGLWQAQRPFMAQRRAGICPSGAAAEALAPLNPDETLGGKDVFLTLQVRADLRRMITAARRALPKDHDAPDALKVFSGFRSPEGDAQRCAAEQNCQGLVRAECSAHRTGLAVDIDLGAAPGFSPDSSADTNRLFISRTPVYRWLVWNAARYGFVNYAFEPWHWEWVGSAFRRQEAEVHFESRQFR